MAVLGMGKALVVVVVLCMMPVGMAIIDLEAILEVVDAAAISIVTVVHLQTLGLWWEKALEAEALAPVVLKGAWLNHQIELPVLVLAAAAAFCGRRFWLLLGNSLAGEASSERDREVTGYICDLSKTQWQWPLQTRHVLGTFCVSKLFL